jgi:hypothetical protein
MSLSLPDVRRVPLVLAVVAGLLSTSGAAPARRHVAAPGDLVASPSLSILGNVTAGINTEVDVTITNTTNQAVLLTDVVFNTVNAQGLAQVNITVPANGSAQAVVFMGPAGTGPAVMRVRWRGGSESTNWVTITANGT